MKHNLSKVKEVVHVARCQWAVGTDAEGNDIVPFGLLWERKSFDDAAIIVEEHGAKTYGEGRQYHVWLERVTRHDDGSEESVVVREYNRPAPESETPESGYTPCACRDCMDVAVSSNWFKPELCLSCRSAGCLNYSHRPNLDFEGGSEFECQRADAYGEC